MARKKSTKTALAALRKTNIAAEKKRKKFSQQELDRQPVPGKGGPLVWRTSPPGTPYHCPENRYVGRTTKDGWTVVSCATPLRLKPGRSKKMPRRQIAYVLQDQSKPVPRVIVAPGSVVREWFRERGGFESPVPRGVYTGEGLKKAIEREIREGTHIPVPLGLPYPTRKGSTPCYPHHPVWQEFFHVLHEREGMMGELSGGADTRFEPALFSSGKFGAPSPVVVDPRVLHESLRGTPEYQRALEAERSCVQKWISHELKARPKAVFSSTREAARRRIEAINQGVDLASAEYRDTLADSTRRRGIKKKLRPQIAPIPIPLTKAERDKQREEQRKRRARYVPTRLAIPSVKKRKPKGAGKRAPSKRKAPTNERRHCRKKDRYVCMVRELLLAR